MTGFPVPLVAPYILWLSHPEPVAAKVGGALVKAFAPHGYEVRDLNDSANPLMRAQSVSHDIRTLLRETGSRTALWAYARGHNRSVVIGAVRNPEPWLPPAHTYAEAPLLPSSLAVVTVHRDLLSDAPQLVRTYYRILSEAIPGRDIALTDELVTALQDEAEALRRDGLIAAPVDVRRWIAPDYLDACADTRQRSSA